MQTLRNVLYYSCKIGMVNCSNENAPSLSVAVRTNIHTYHTTKESDMSIPLKPKIPPERPLEINGEAGTKVQIQRGSAKSLSKKRKEVMYLKLLSEADKELSYPLECISEIIFSDMLPEDGAGHRYACTTIRFKDKTAFTFRSFGWVMYFDAVPD